MNVFCTNETIPTIVSHNYLRNTFKNRSQSNRSRELNSYKLQPKLSLARRKHIISLRNISVELIVHWNVDANMRQVAQ